MNELGGILSIFIGFLLVFSSFVIIWAIIRHLKLRPSNDRSWVNDNDKLAKAEFGDNLVTIRNVRDFRWRTTKDYDENWIDMKFDLNKISKLWFVLEYFGLINL